jgi:hypothetical protein
MNSPARNDVSCFLCGQHSDRHYATTQYTHVNNGGRDVFCVVVAVVILSMKPVPVRVKRMGIQRHTARSRRVKIE